MFYRLLATLAVAPLGITEDQLLRFVGTSQAIWAPIFLSLGTLVGVSTEGRIRVSGPSSQQVFEEACKENLPLKVAMLH